MKYLNVLAGLLATTSAASIPRQSAPVWSITNFFASGAPISIETEYRFDITDGALSTHCSGTISTQPGISYLPVTNCVDPTYQFNFGGAPEASGEDGYNLEIWEDTCGSTCVYVGVQFFPASDVVTVTDPSGNPNGDFEVLETAANFTVASTGTHI